MQFFQRLFEGYTNANVPEGLAPMSDAYQRARKSYTLFSGILLAWELVGVSVPTEPFTSVKVTFTNPDTAPPLVFAALIFFFGFRTSIEWLQNDIGRRELLASRFDINTAHTIAIGSLGLMAYNQVIGQIKLPLLGQEPDAFLSFSLLPIGVIFSFLFGLLLMSVQRYGRREFFSNPGRTPRVLFAGFLSTTMFTLMVFVLQFGDMYTASALFVAFIIGGMLAGLVVPSKTTDK